LTFNKFEKPGHDKAKHEVIFSDGKSRRAGDWRYENRDKLSRIWEKDESGSTISDDVSSESSIDNNPNIVQVPLNSFNLPEPQLGPGGYFDFEQFL